MIPIYVPVFTHTDWIDNEDRVQAGGENGFNIRFHNLETEFRTLADEHLNPVINTLSKALTCLSLTPILEPNRPDLPLQARWELNFDVAQKPTSASEAHGIMNVVLPQDAGIKSLLVTGDRQPPGNPMPTIVLRRRDISGGPGAETLISVSGFGTPATPSTPATVDNTRYKYFIEADLPTVPTTDTVKLFCFQITYQ